MDTLKNWGNKLAQAFLPVNNSAGKLRVFLLGLMAFIFWTFNAQIRSIPSDGLIRLNAENGFIADVLLDLVVRYFHPATLLVTSIPLVLFFFARLQAATLLSGTTDGGIKTARAFLSRCAFSINDIAITIPLPVQNRSSHRMNILRNMGGPASISIAPAHCLLVQQTGSADCLLLMNQNDNESTVFELAHQQKILGWFASDHLRLKMHPQGLSAPLIFQLHPSTPAKDHPNGNVSKVLLSSDDACCLLELKQTRRFLFPFLNGLLESFINQRRQMRTPFHPHPTPYVQNKKNSTKLHENYAQTVYSAFPRKKWFVRPHRFSHYPDQRLISSRSRDHIHEPSSAGNAGLDELEIFVRQAMVSFFDLDHIQISMKKEAFSHESDRSIQ